MGVGAGGGGNGFGLGVGVRPHLHILKCTVRIRDFLSKARLKVPWVK